MCSEASGWSVPSGARCYIHGTSFQWMPAFCNVTGTRIIIVWCRTCRETGTLAW